MPSGRTAGGRLKTGVFFDAAPCGFLIVAPDWRIQKVNATFADWMGRDADDLAEAHLRDLLDVGGRIFFDTHFAPLVRLQGGFHEVALNLKRADGSKMAALVNAAEHFAADGTVEAVLVTVFNATDRRRYEAELVTARNALRELNEGLEERVRLEVESRLATENVLRQAQKMEAVGNLSGGIAHDFNNILQIVSANLGLAARRVSGDATSYIQNAQAGVEKGAQLAHQLLAFARRTPVSTTVADAATVVAGLHDMIVRTLGAEVAIELDLPDTPLPVEIDTSQLENAVLNLSINARDAMAGLDGAGTLAIAVRAVEPGSPDLPDGLHGRHVEVRVGDTGEGMDADTLAKVFEPFFTTKPAGKGTGLGLAMVYGFARQSGGRVTIASEAGRGTAVSIWLPRTSKALASGATLPQGGAFGGTETILIVEDNETVRAATRALLTDLGYTVLEASDGDGARAHLTGPAPIHLTMFDLILRGLQDGMELVRDFQARGYEGRLLLTSGHADEFEGHLDRSIELLRKPYDRAALAGAVRRVLGTGGMVTPAAMHSAPLPAPETRAAEGVRILVVEDDFLIRLSTADQLGDLGHSVLEAGSGEEALDIVGRETIDVLLVDLGLPGMSGEELARTVRRDHPDIAIVFATGAKEAPELDGLPALYLDKPYRDADLRKVLQGFSRRRATAQGEAIG